MTQVIRTQAYPPAHLIAAARAARRHAHAPYSGFTVGTAIQLADGSVVVGANLENASIGLSLCAEAVALGAANAAGRLADMIAIAVVGDRATNPTGAVVTPCGRCRQMLSEAQDVAGRPLLIYCAPVEAADDGATRRFTVADLLPHGFGSGWLERPPGND